MKTLETILTPKGQVTIPVEIRIALNLKPKDRILFELVGGIIKIRPASSKLLRGFRSVSSKGRHENFSYLRTNFEKSVAKEVIEED